MAWKPAWRTNLFNNRRKPVSAFWGIHFFGLRAALVLSMSMSICVFFAPALSFANPIISIDTPAISIGRVMEGKVLSVQFEIRNAGDEPLRLDTERVSPGVRVMSVSPWVQPGEVGWVWAERATAGHAGESPAEIVLSTNDPSRPAVTLTIGAEIVAPFVLDPTPIELGEGQSCRHVIVANKEYGDTLPKIISIRPGPGAEVLTGRYKTLAEDRWQLDLSMRKTNEPIPEWAIVELVTNIPELTVYNLRCHLRDY